MIGSAFNVVTRALVLFVLWMLLVDTVDERQLLAGVGVTAGAVLLGAAIPGRERSRIRIRPAMLRKLHRPLVQLVSDTVVVTTFLLVRIARRGGAGGRFRVVRYRATGDSEEDRARRVLTEWAGSVAPNRYVIGIDRDRRVLLIHELVPRSGPLDPLELG